MPLKRIPVLFLLFLLSAALMGGCGGINKNTNKNNNKESSVQSNTPAETEDSGSYAVICALSYISAELKLPADFADKAGSAVYYNDRLYFADGDKIYSTDRNAESIREVEAYAPLEDYSLLILGTAYSGGLLAVEKGNGGCLVSLVEEDGSVASVTDITAAIESYKDFRPQKCFSDIDGNIYFYINRSLISGNTQSDNDDSVLIVGADGESFSKAKINSNSTATGLALSGGGSAYIILQDEADTASFAVRDNEVIGKIGVGMSGSGTVHKLYPDGTLGNSLLTVPLNTNLYNGGVYDLLYSDGEGLYALDSESGNTAFLFRWVTYGFSGPFITDVLDAGKYALLCRYYNGKFYLFEEGYEPERTVLRLAHYGKNYYLDLLVSAYNNGNDKYKIVMEDYSLYDEGVTGAGLIRLNADIQAGNAPDIIDFSAIPADAYEIRGLLTDLYPFIDADPDIERSDLLAPYIRAYERGGRLYQALIGFSMDCFIGKSSVVGAGHGWTLSEVLAVQDKFAPEAPGLGGLSREEAITRYIDSIYTDFVNWESGSCSFNSEEFINILDFLAALSRESDTKKQSVDLVLSGETAFVPLNLYGVSQLVLYDTLFGDEGYTIKGYPSKSGSGIVMVKNFYPSPGISAACNDKEGAWSFVRTLFSEYASELTGLPVSKKALNLSLSKAMSDDVWVNKGNGLEMNLVRLNPATQEQVDRYYELIESCDLVRGGDGYISAILEEELRPFLAGDKTARETADIIQSRVQLYVSEQK